MIPKEIIAKAIEGGFDWWGYLPEAAVETDEWYQARAALNPLFWQALGKALGWEKYSEGNGFWGQTSDGEYAQDLTWKTNAHRFYDLILTGGSTDEFWADLLK